MYKRLQLIETGNEYRKQTELITPYVQVSWQSWLFLCGLYIASLSSILGSLYGAPRVFQVNNKIKC